MFEADVQRMHTLEAVKVGVICLFLICFFNFVLFCSSEQHLRNLTAFVSNRQHPTNLTTSRLFGFGRSYNKRRFKKTSS